MINKKSQATTSVLSIVMSFLATSHHWLHMGILFILGGSTNLMATTSTVVWVRRFMIVATLITALISVYRLFKHRCKVPWVISLTTMSILLSIGFIIYTLSQFGW
jgi:hypothetical protein